MYEIVYLRKVDAGTDNECWVLCALGDLGAVAFVPQSEMEDATREAYSDGYSDGGRDEAENRE